MKNTFRNQLSDRFKDTLQIASDIARTYIAERKPEQTQITLHKIEELLNKLLELREKHPRHFELLVFDREYFASRKQASPEEDLGLYLEMEIAPGNFYPLIELAVRSFDQLLKTATEHQSVDATNLIVNISTRLVRRTIKFDGMENILELWLKFLQEALRTSFKIKSSTRFYLSAEWYFECTRDVDSFGDVLPQYHRRLERYVVESLMKMIEFDDVDVFDWFLEKLYDRPANWHVEELVHQFHEFELLQNMDDSFRTQFRKLDKILEKIATINNQHDSERLDHLIDQAGLIVGAIADKEKSEKFVSLLGRLDQAARLRSLTRRINSLALVGASYALHRRAYGLLDSVRKYYRRPDDHMLRFRNAFLPLNADDLLNLLLDLGPTFDWGSRIQGIDEGFWRDCLLVVITTDMLKLNLITTGVEFTSISDEWSSGRLAALRSRAEDLSKLTMILVQSKDVDWEYLYPLDLKNGPDEARNGLFRTKELFERIADQAKIALERMEQIVSLDSELINEFVLRVSRELDNYWSIPPILEYYGHLQLSTRETSESKANILGPIGLPRSIFLKDWYVDSSIMTGNIGELIALNVDTDILLQWSERLESKEVMDGRYIEAVRSAISEIRGVRQDSLPADEIVVVGSVPDIRRIFDFTNEDFRRKPKTTNGTVILPRNYYGNYKYDDESELSIYYSHHPLTRGWLYVLDVESIGVLKILNPDVLRENANLYGKPHARDEKFQLYIQDSAEVEARASNRCDVTVSYRVKYISRGTVSGFKIRIAQ